MHVTKPAHAEGCSTRGARKTPHHWYAQVPCVRRFGGGSTIERRTPRSSPRSWGLTSTDASAPSRSASSAGVNDPDGLRLRKITLPRPFHWSAPELRPGMWSRNSDAASYASTITSRWSPTLAASRRRVTTLGFRHRSRQLGGCAPSVRAGSPRWSERRRPSGRI
jgi:hypothetical protein